MGSLVGWVCVHYSTMREYMEHPQSMDLLLSDTRTHCGQGDKIFHLSCLAWVLALGPFSFRLSMDRVNLAAQPNPSEPGNVNDFL